MHTLPFAVWQVDFDTFLGQYWPRFDVRLTRGLEPSMVFAGVLSLPCTSHEPSVCSLRLQPTAQRITSSPDLQWHQGHWPGRFTCSTPIGMKYHTTWDLRPTTHSAACCVVCAEIQGSIKGSEGSLTSPRGRLSKQQYLDLAGRRCSNLAEGQRLAVYRIFRRYVPGCNNTRCVHVCCAVLCAFAHRRLSQYVLRICLQNLVRTRRLPD